ncbi:DUF1729 domain-containing protein [Leptospira kmetyi]|nr:DUF1729 domain-containing protein [Leptospira kmetyi]
MKELNVGGNGSRVMEPNDIHVFNERLLSEVHVSVLFAGQGSNPLSELMALFEEEGEFSPFFIRLFQAIEVCMDQVRSDGRDWYFKKGFSLRGWLIDPSSIPTEAILKSSYYSGPLVFAAQAANLYRFARNEENWNSIRKTIGGIYGHSQGIFAGLLLSSSPDKTSFLDNFEKTFSALFFLGIQSQSEFPEMELDPEVVRRYAKKEESPSPMAQMYFYETKETLSEILIRFNQSQSRREQVHIGLVNGPNSRVFCGAPEALLKFREELSRSGFEGVKTWNFIASSTPFHSPFLSEVEHNVQVDFQRIGFSPKAYELEIPLYDTRTGKDLRESDRDLASDLVSMVSNDLLDWNVTLSSLVEKDGKHLLLSFGPGDFIEKISSPFLKGRSLLIYNLTQEERFQAFVKTKTFSFPKEWKEYAVEFVTLPNGKEFPKNRYSLWTGRPPVFGGGMTPSTAEPDIVIAAAKEGYIVEWAGGGQVSEEIFRRRMEKISKELPAGKGIVINLLYLDAYLWNLHLPLIKKFKAEGAPIEGVTISAGIPEPEEAVRLLQEWNSVGIWLNSFKPGTVEQIGKVLKIADLLPHSKILMQVEGGAAGGHHSWEDLEELISATYEEIRKRSNIVLAVGGGIGSPKDSALWLSGEWNPKIVMPVDAVFLGTRLMAALECKTSLPIKEELVKLAGDVDWKKTKDGKEVGGVISGRSGLGADIYYASNTWTKLSDLAEKITKGKEPSEARKNVSEKKEELISLLDRTAKPFFGDLASLSYTQVLERFVSLVCPGEKLQWGEGEWPDHPFIDRSYRTRLEDLILGFEGRMLPSETEENSIMEESNVLDNPNVFLKLWKERYPIGDRLLLLPEDRDFFLEVCKRPGKPVNFVPVLDEDLVRWIKSDSLWYSHCVGMDPNACAWIPGPRAVQGLEKVNEPVARILKEFVDGSKTKRNSNGNISWKEFVSLPNSNLPEEIILSGSENITEVSIPSADTIDDKSWIRYLSNQGDGLLSLLLASDRLGGNGSDLRTWFSPRLSRKFSWEKGAAGEFVQICSYKEDGKNIAASLQLLNHNSAELILFFDHPGEKNSVPFRKRFIAGESPDCIVSEDKNFFTSEIRNFYAQVWKVKNIPDVINSYKSLERSEDFQKEWTTRILLTEESIIRFRKATQDYFRKDLSDDQPSLSPLSMGVVFSWESTVLPLFEYTASDLFRLLHLSQEFHWKPEAADLKVGDSVVSKSKISRVEKMGDATVLYVSGKMWNGEIEIAGFETGFLLRGEKGNSLSFDTDAVERSIEIVSQAEAEVIGQLSWIKNKSETPAIQVGDRIRFVTDKRILITDEKQTIHKIQGRIFRSNSRMSEILYGSFLIDEKTSPHADSSFDRLFKVYQEADPTIPLQKKYRILSDVFQAPEDMTSYSAASGDANPIHTDIRFAEMGGWERPIVHGLWTSSQVVNRLIRYVCDGDSSRMISFREYFEGPVFPGEELKLEAYHVAQNSGDMVLEITLENRNKEVKLRANGRIRPPKTAYVFTGQGSQSQGMGMKLLEEFSEAKEVWASAEKVAVSELGFSLLEVVKNNPTSIRCGGKDWVHPKGVLNLTQFTQVALVAKSLADWAILKKRGYLKVGSPFAGHSLGEFSALSAREFIHPENVFKIVFNRGLTMQSLVPRDEQGKSSYAMSVVLGNRHVGLYENKILELVEEAKQESGLHLEVVNYNIRDKQYSVTGNIQALELLEEKCKKFARGKKTTIRLEGIDVPFHSRVLISGVPEFRKTLEANIGPDLPLRDLDGRYIPNLVALPFGLSDEFLQSVFQTAGSQVASDLLKLSHKERDNNETRRLLLIELLAFQFAMPVQWIRSQEILFDRLGTRRLIDIGARGDLAGMARQTLKDKSDSSHYQVLHIEENRNEVFYEKEDVEEAVWKISIPESEEEERIDSPETQEVVSVTPTQVKSTEESARNVSESLDSPSISLERKDALFSLLALKASVRIDEILETETIDDLFGGNSSKRNQALADIGVEFKTNALEGAHEKPLKDFVKVLEERMPYEQPGPYLRSAFEEVLKKFFPPDYGRKEIFQHLKEERLLNEQGVFAFILQLPLIAREGDSLRSGKLSAVGLKARLANAKEAARWLDQAVDQFALLKKVQIPKRSAFSNATGGGKVDSAALEALERKYFGLEGLFAKSLRDLRKRLLDDDPYSEFLIQDLKSIEEARSVLLKKADDITPAFTEKKFVSFRNSKQWAKKRILVRAAAFLRGEIREFSNEDFLYLGNHQSPEIYEIVNYWEGYLDRKAQSSSGTEKKESYLNAGRQFSNLKQWIQSKKGKPSVFVYPKVVHSPILKKGTDGSIVCEERKISKSPASVLSGNFHLETSSDFGSSFSKNEKITLEYSKILNELCESGISFSGKKVLVTGAGPGSIAWEVVKAFLSGGAEVLLTTTSYSSTRIRILRELYQKYGSQDSSLEIVPFSQGSLADIRSLTDWLGERKWNPDFLIPFAAVGEENSVSSLDDSSLVSIRVMLLGVEKLIGELGKLRKNIGEQNSKLNVILPLSPNHGIFGRDGMYAETKIGLETLFRKRYSEAADWGNSVRILGAVIGWVRGTGLMEANDLLAPVLESKTEVRTFSRSEMGLLISCLSALSASNLLPDVVKADFTGRLGNVENLGEILTKIRTDLVAQMKKNGEIQSIFQKLNVSSSFHRKIKALPKQGLRFPEVPSEETLAEFKPISNLRPQDLVCVVGYAEVGPAGSSLTRWELEKNGTFSLESCVELAWNMGYIRYQSGQNGKVWTDAKTGEAIPEWLIKEKYEKEILEHSGIRIVDHTSSGYDPTEIAVFADVVLEEDLMIPISGPEEAEEFRKADPQTTEIYNNPSTEKWFIKRKKGSVLKVKKAVGIQRRIAGQIPDGWDPEKYGIPKDLIRQVDAITVYNLYCTCEAYLRAGLDPFELFEYIHPSQAGSSVGSGMGGMKKIKRMFLDFRHGEERQHDSLQESLINVTAAWAITSYAGIYGTMQTPVAACATGGVSLELARDAILAGKAKFMIAGAFDDTLEESMIGFGDMNATANTSEMAEQGILTSEVCRPNDVRRNGFVESQGGGVVLLARGDVALRMGLPVYGLLGFAGSRTDGIQTSIPAPGVGLLSLAANSKTEVSPLQSALDSYGLKADDIGFAYKHDTSTKANDKNENNLLHKLMLTLGRTPGNNLPVVSQKALTGHSKAGAAMWQSIGVIQSLEEGILTGNRNLDDVDSDMNPYSFIAFSDESIRFGKNHWKAGMLTSLGFGHIGVLCLFLHRNFFWGILNEEERKAYIDRCRERGKYATHRYNEIRLGNGTQLYERRTHSYFEEEDEESALLDASYRSSYFVSK